MDALDKQIKSLLEDHEVPVDTQELWRSVEPRLGKNRSYRRLLFLLFLLIGLPLAYLLFTLPGKQQPTLQSSPLVTKNSFFGRKGQLVNINPETDTQHNQAPVLPHFTEENKSVLVTDPQKSKTRKESIPSGLEKGIKENDVKAESNITSLHSSDRFDLLKPGIMLSTKKVATNTVIQPVISLFNQKIQSPGIKPMQERVFSFSLDVFAGFDYVDKTLLTKAYDYRWYREERYNTEKYVEGFNLGLQLNVEHKSGLFAGSGLVYHQVNELFSSEGMYEFRTYKEGIVEIITHADGSSSEVTGQKLVIEQKSWNKRKYNHYNFLNVPVHIGYQHAMGPIHIAYAAGVDFNLHFSQQGEIIGHEGFPVSVSQPQNSIFRNLTSVNLNGGIKLLYPLSDRWVLYAEPNVHYNVYSITSTDNPLEQRYLHTGIRIGTRFNL